MDFERLKKLKLNCEADEINICCCFEGRLFSSRTETEGVSESADYLEKNFDVSKRYFQNTNYQFIFLVIMLRITFMGLKIMF